MKRFFEAFEILPYDFPIQIDESKLEKLRRKDFKGKQIVPDIQLYSFYRAIANADTYREINFFTTDTQRNMKRYLEGINENKLNVVMLLCNGLFPTIEYAHIVESILSDEDLDIFRQAYGIGQGTKREKIEEIIGAQEFHFSFLNTLGVECWKYQTNLINDMSN